MNIFKGHDNKNNDILNNSNIIKKWIKSFNNKFLEIFLRYLKKENKSIDIKNEYYKLAIDQKNFDGWIILFNNDERSINEILCYILNEFEGDRNEEQLDNFLKYLNSSKSFNEMDFYYNDKYGNEDKDKYSFLNEYMFKYKILEIKTNIETYKEKIEEIKDTLIKDGKVMDKQSFKNYIKNNDSLMRLLKGKNFDILIYSIENFVSKDVIEYIINEFSYKNLNYGNKIKTTNNDYTEIKQTFEKIIINYKNNKDSSIYQNIKNHYKESGDLLTNRSYNNLYSKYKTTYRKTPLYTALSKNNFEIADVLINNGSNINYKEDIIYSLYRENLLNCENLNYILNHGYNVSKWLANDKKIYHWIKCSNNEFLEIYFNYIQNMKKENIKNNIQKNNECILEQYYKLSIYYNNYNAIIILYNYYSGIEKDENIILCRLFLFFMSFEEERYKKF
ncbi:hypothetical protein BCR36DRAFT_293838, partial [Piromyces finnis]